MPKRKKAAKAAPAGMAVSSPHLHVDGADKQGRSNNRPAAKQLPGATKPSAPPGAPAAPSMPTGGAATSRPVPKPAMGGGAGRAPPPPPAPPAAPPAPARPAKQMYKALYAFAGQEGEVALVKGELVEVKEKDENGMSPSLSIRLYIRS
jgi:myosin-1